MDAMDSQANSQFMGALVFAPHAISTSAHTSFQVIDGQQRLTTVSLLLVALRDRAKVVAPTSSLAPEIELSYLIHQFGQDENRYRILPRNHDRIAFLAAIDGDAIAPSGIFKAVNFFEKCLTPLTNDEAQCCSLFNQIKKMEFVHILLDGENPYQIFSSLNSTGVDLTHADLIRNAVFLPIPAAQQENFDTKKWEPMEKVFEQTNDKGETNINTQALSDFYRDVLISKGQYVRPIETFQKFEKDLKDRALSPDAVADELAAHLSRYKLLLRHTNHPNPQVSDGLHRFLDLDTATAFPLALELLRRETLVSSDSHHISSEDLALAFDSLASFILRRYVCGETSRSYGKDFPKAISELGDAPLVNLQNFLNGRGWPDDSRFKTALVRFNLYKSGYARAVLIALNEHNHKENLVAANLTIEHILPQTKSAWWEAHVPDFDSVQANYLHTIGNLTITAYNAEFGNRPFPDKAKGWTKADGTNVLGYQNSNARLTREVALNAQWTQNEIELRAQTLAQTACVVWKKE